MNQTKSKDPLTLKGLIKRITLLPLNYTRHNAIIVYNRYFCPYRERGHNPAKTILENISY
jgi:hypothetical protein